MDFRMSYSWRSVRGTLASVKEGVRWRVGDDWYINIWQDAWLSGFGHGLVLSAPPSNLNLVKVEDLIRSHTRQ